MRDNYIGILSEKFLFHMPSIDGSTLFWLNYLKNFLVKLLSNIIINHIL